MRSTTGAGKPQALVAFGAPPSRQSHEVAADLVVAFQDYSKLPQRRFYDPSVYIRVPSFRKLLSRVSTSLFAHARMPRRTHPAEASQPQRDFDKFQGLGALCEGLRCHTLDLPGQAQVTVKRRPAPTKQKFRIRAAELVNFYGQHVHDRSWSISAGLLVPTGATWTCRCVGVNCTRHRIELPEKGILLRCSPVPSTAQAPSRNTPIFRFQSSTSLPS